MGAIAISIIIPAYNEANTIHLILDKVLGVNRINNISKEIIIVNDCSTDNTPKVIEFYSQGCPNDKIVLFNQPVNKGKGAFLRKGIKAAAEDYIMIQDADLEYDPEDYNLLLKTMLEENLKAICGSRFLKKENKHSYQTFYLGAFRNFGC